MFSKAVLKSQVSGNIYRLSPKTPVLPGDYCDKSELEYLLDRSLQFPHAPRINLNLKGKRLLITGAGGSIGSELCRQAAAAKVKQLVMVDRCEEALYDLRCELGDVLAQEGLNEEVAKYRLGDVCDFSRLRQIFAECRPELVIHTAAFKHLDLLEQNHSEAFKNNVLGALYTFRAASNFAAKAFIHVSTDKAVEPSSALGFSKRLAELALLRVAHEMSLRLAHKTPPPFVHERSLRLAHEMPGKHSGTQVRIVRFGNVLGSSGSVLPLFRKQLLSNKPLTLTHPEAKRYFIAPAEAAQMLLLTAIAPLSTGIYALDMAEPIAISKLARRFLDYHRASKHPLTIVGLREGEKLEEILAHCDEELLRTEFAGLWRIVAKDQGSSAQPA